jgi:hypothetical protein
MQALHEKDNIIETMRIELAELHLQAAEQSHAGDGRLQHLEKEILDTKMLNARLLEENESFQMLLSEKTLKGDFVAENHDEDTSGLNTLEEELGNIGDDPEAQSEAVKKLEAENRQVKDQNKALKLYVDKIIGRLLSNPGYEHLILGNDADDKDMPPPPPPKGKALPAPPAGEEVPQSGMGGFLQRAKSVVSRGAPGPPRPRPNSIIQNPVQPRANENPITAPSIPLNRGHRRGRSDQTQQETGMGAATVVQQMTRSSTFRTPSSGPLSPGLGPVSPQQSLGNKSYFPSPPPHDRSLPASRAPSHNLQQPATATGSSRNSVASDNSFTPGADRSSITDISSTMQPSTSNMQGPNALPGAVMKQNQMRPLRLVNQVKDEEEAARKASNRGSWMGMAGGWFNKGDQA